MSLLNLIYGLTFTQTPFRCPLGLHFSGIFKYAKKLAFHILTASKWTVSLQWLSSKTLSQALLLNVVNSVRRMEYLTAKLGDSIKLFIKTCDLWDHSMYGFPSLLPTHPWYCTITVTTLMTFGLNLVPDFDVNSCSLNCYFYLCYWSPNPYCTSLLTPTTSCYVIRLLYYDYFVTFLGT